MPLQVLAREHNYLGYGWSGCYNPILWLFTPRSGVTIMTPESRLVGERAMELQCGTRWRFLKGLLIFMLIVILVVR